MQLSLFHSKPTAAKSSPSHFEEKIRSVLGPRLPSASVEGVVEQIAENPISIRVVGQRTSKSGDFRAAHKGDPARITVNGNLNPYAFLITLIHELAHHHANLDHSLALQKFSFRRKSRPLPHGREWKSKFRHLMAPYLNAEVFSDDILPVLLQYLENPKASSSADHHLSKVLKKYDPPDTTMRLEELSFDAVFTLHSRRTFQKRKR